MRKESRARRRAFAAGIRVWLVLVILAPGFGSALQPEPVREALKDSEWFDYDKDDYRRYNPEDIELPDDDWRCRSPETEVEAPELGVVSIFLNGLVYLVLAAVAALIFYLIYRVIQERGDQPELLEELTGIGIEHGELPAELARAVGAREPLNQTRLRELIESALSTGDLRSASIYLYLFALLKLQALGLLDIRGDQTARDYLRQLDGVAAAPPTIDFPAMARLFEFALYRGRLPDDTNEEFVRGLWRGLDAAKSAMASGAGGAA
ncbi:MAG: hypothetical protein RIF32_12515 [Leptospirales bacterium]